MRDLRHRAADWLVGSGGRRTIGGCAVALIVAALTAAGMRVAPPGGVEIAGDLPPPTTVADPVPPASPTPAPAPSVPSPAAVAPQTPSATAAPTARPTPGGLVVPDAGVAADDTSRTGPPSPSGASAATDAFARRFPEHAQAVQDPRRPATTRWAVLVGINEHQGRTRDNLGSRQDAVALGAHLRSLGWRDDHVLVLTDADATRDMIVAALEWLADRTDEDSVAVFHYSGHTKQWPGRDVDGDGETTDEALWPSDNRHLPDGEWVGLMSAVDVGRLWINIGACEAAGFLDPGLERAGRIITYSSAEDEKSYEDPSVGHSVWGAYLVAEGLVRGHADADGDGAVTVEEAVAYAAPRARRRTERQRYGPQHGGVVDRVEGAFTLTVPEPPPEPPPPAPTPSEETTPDEDEDDDGGCLVLCSATPAGRRR